MSSSKGKLIAAIGLPGSGKSSVLKALGKNLQIPTFHEPEESEYHEVVKNRALYGSFTAMTWFRSARIPLLYEAHRLRNEGQLVMIDSYYDKLFGRCLEKEGMSWLIKKSDPYFPVMKRITQLDMEMLPHADVLISFELDYDTWIKFLQLRNRDLLDNDELFLQSYQTQAHFIEAAEYYAREFGSQLVRFKQEFSSLEASAERLKKQLESLSIIEMANH